MVITSNSQLGKVREEINIILQGEPLQIAFNSKYLIDVLKNAETEEIVKFAKCLGILVVEDCSLSIGTKKKDKLLGITGDAAIFSLELSKTISVGWGGILIINNKNLQIMLSFVPTTIKRFITI